MDWLFLRIYLEGLMHQDIEELAHLTSAKSDYHNCYV